MKAGIVVDDWKLPVFRKRLTEAGYTYEDGGAPMPGTTLLTVECDAIPPLGVVVLACQAECGKKPHG